MIYPFFLSLQHVYIMYKIFLCKWTETENRKIQSLLKQFGAGFWHEIGIEHTTILFLEMKTFFGAEEN